MAAVIVAFICTHSFGQALNHSADSSHNAAPVTAEEQAKGKGPAPSMGESKRIAWMSSLEFSLSALVLGFGVLVFLAELFVIKVGGYSPNQSTKLIAVTLIIVATLFIITAGFSSEQIAPAMGLFGTVAGYLLGRTQAASEVKDA